MACWSYLDSLDTPENRAFVDEWRQFTRAPRAMTSDSMEASRVTCRLWTDAVAAAGPTEVAALRKALAGRSVRARAERLRRAHE